MIERHCPLLLRSFVPPSERLGDLDLDETEPANILEDPEHTCVVIDVKGFAADGTASTKCFQIGKDVSSLRKFKASSPLSIHLRDAF
jgi:hypothetical protein